jgi:hypothetical protein
MEPIRHQAPARIVGRLLAAAIGLILVTLFLLSLPQHRSGVSLDVPVGRPSSAPTTCIQDELVAPCS